MKKTKSVRIMVTGGHITPALAVIEEMRRRFPDWDILLVGRHIALEEGKVESEEERLTKRQNIRFVPLTTGRLTRAFSMHTIFSLFKIPLGFLQAFFYVVRFTPSVIVSFGGYVSFPVVFAGWILQVPIITHEQTRVPGLTNRIIGMFAKRVCVSFKDQVRPTPIKKIVYTGLPIRRGMFEKAKTPRWMHGLSKPVLFITGGSTGSASMNRLFFPIMSHLLQDYTVVHQTGRLSYQEAHQLKHNLPTSLGARYIIFPYIDLPLYAWVMQHAYLVVGRSGANTVGEAAALGKVSLLIPLPWSAGREQEANARYLEEHGTSFMLDQQSLSSEKLEEKIKEISTKKSEMERRAKSLSQKIPRDASARLVREIYTLLQNE